MGDLVSRIGQVHAAARRRAWRSWAEALIKIARMTLTIKLDGNWSSFQLANSAPPLSVTGSAIAPSARMGTLSRLCGSPAPAPTSQSIEAAISRFPTSCHGRRDVRRYAGERQRGGGRTHVPSQGGESGRTPISSSANLACERLQEPIDARVLVSPPASAFPPQGKSLGKPAALAFPIALPLRVSFAWRCAVPGKLLRAPEQAQGRPSPAKNGCD